MLVTILMLGLALVCAAIGIWAMRRPAAGGEAQSRRGELAGGVAAAGSDQQIITELQHPPRSATSASASAPNGAARAAAAPSNRTASHPSLAFLDFDGTLGRVHVERPEVVIGRHSQDDIRINDVRVSRHHARLVAKRDGGFEIHNLTAVRSEPNPMQINGETREHADIVDGDVVTLGGVSFVFRQAA